MEIEQTTYEDIMTKNGITLNHSIKLPQKRNTMKEHSEVYHCIEDIEINDEAEDIYEVIPAEFAPCSWSEKTSRSSSISSQGSNRSERVRNVSIGIQTDNESMLSTNSSPETTAQSAHEHTEHYAEILHATDLEVTEITPSTRPTRESDNPMLRQDFAQLTENSQLIPELQDIRSSFSLISKSRYSDSTAIGRLSELPAHLLLKRSLSSGDNRNGYFRSVEVFYENSPLPSPHQSPQAKHVSTSAPVYQNVTFPLVESDRESHCSTTSTEGHSVTSEEDCAANVESLYENVTNGYRQRTSSHPIDIVYSDLDFHKEKSHQHVSEESAEEIQPYGVIERSKSVSAKSISSYSAPRAPSPRGGIGLSRPKSLCLRQLASGALGLHLARFVKKVSVQRSNDKTLQATISEVLAKRHSDDDEPSVNVEVNSDLVRISTNFPPWEVIASCDIETVGHVNLYEEDPTILGIIACAHGQEPTCYIIRCQDANTIYETIKNAFKAPNLRQFSHYSTPEGSPVHESFTSIPHITYLGSVKVKQSYLVINDSIVTLLDKLNPRDFKPITLKIRPDEIVVVDESSQHVLHQHSVSWVLSLGVFSDDPRLFGYIVTEARQGERTRMFCHAFRGCRVTASVTATETIRMACQSTCSSGRKDSLRSRRDSQRSLRSSTSSDFSSSLERRSSTGDPIERLDNKLKETKVSPKSKTPSPARLLRKLTPKKSSFTPKASFRSYTSEPNLTSLSSSSSVEGSDSAPSLKTTPDIIEEKEFRAFYLCSTVINPPLRPKHVRDSVKQYLKELKKLGKHGSTSQIIKEVDLLVAADGVTMSDPQCRHIGQRYFPFPCISDVRTHKDFPEYFAFSTVVTGDTKHKCHIFKQVNEPCGDITAAFESFLWEKV